MTNRTAVFERKKITWFFILIFLLWGIFLLSVKTYAAIRKEFNYQGKLTDSSGIAMPDGVYDVTFKIYNQAGGGSAVFSESWINAALFTDAGTTVTNDGCATGIDKVGYTSDANEASLAAGQTLWNITKKQSAVIESVNTASNYICVYDPAGIWANSDQVTNRIYVKNGLFSVMVGSVSYLGLSFTGGNYYLGVTIGSDAEMTPRKKIGSVPQAWNANNLVGDGYIDISNASTSTNAANISYNPVSGAYGALSVSYGNAGGTGTALTVSQSGTGNIVDIKDGATSVFKIVDGGTVIIAGNTNITGTVGVTGDENLSGVLSVGGNVNVSGVINGGADMVPNLLKNSYMDILSGSAPAGYSGTGVTIQAVSAFTKGFEGCYQSTNVAPCNAATPDEATVTSQYWYGSYNKGPRIQRGGLAGGWHSLNDGNILKITGTGIASGGHSYVSMPFEKNVLGSKWHFKAWVKIVKGSQVCFGSDAGWNGSANGVCATKAVADATAQGWYRFNGTATTSQITSLDGLSLSLGTLPDASGDVEVYVALPYVANLNTYGTNQETWVPSINDSLARDGFVIHPATNNIGIGTTSPTAVLHLKAGTSTANTAPLKFTSGTNLTTPEAGAIEYNGTQLYFSPSTTRNILAQISGSAALVSGSIPFATTNGYLTGDGGNFFWDNVNKRLGIGTGSPTTKLHISGDAFIDGNAYVNGTLTVRSASYDNFLANGNFETVLGSNFSAWIDLGGQFTSTTDAHNGNRALLGTGNAGTSDFNSNTFIPINKGSGEKLVLEYWYKTSPGYVGQAGMWVASFQKDGVTGNLDWNGCYVSAASTSWIKKTCSYNLDSWLAGKDAQYIRPAITLRSSIPVGETITFDDIKIYKSYGTSSIGASMYYDDDNINYYLDPSGNATGISLLTSGSVGIGTTSPTAVLHLKAGTAAANTAPLKFTSGTNLTTPEAGVMEYDGTNLYFTPAGTRKTIAFNDSNITGTASNVTGTVNVANGGTGTTTLTGVIKGNGTSAFTAMTGTSNYVTRWTDANTLGNGVLYDDGTNVGIGTTSPSYKLDVKGAIGSQNGVSTVYQGPNNFSGGFNVYKRGQTGDANAAIVSNAEIGYHGFFGWDGSAYGRGAYVLTRATQDWTASAHGTSYSIAVTSNDTTTSAMAMIINPDLSTRFYGNVGIGVSPTAVLHLKAGTASAGSAPLKFTSGTNLTTPEQGVMEYDGTNLYFTPIDIRKTIAFTDSNITGTASNITGTVNVANGGTGATSLTGVIKGNGTSAFTAMTGTANYITRWTDSNTLGTGSIYDDGTNVGIGTTSPTALLEISQNSASTALTITQNGDGDLVNVLDSGISIFKIGQATVDVTRPLDLQVEGDVGVEYDLQFLNNAASHIYSAGPLTISAGDSNSYEHLTLTTSGTGDVIVDIADSLLGFKVVGIGGQVFSIDPSGNVRVGGVNANNADLTVKGNISTPGGNLALNSLATPGGVTVTPVGTAGTTAYGYRVSAINGNGETLASTTVATTTGNVTLDTANYNRIAWAAVSGATGYKIYGRTSGSELYMATVNSPTLYYNDTNAATPAGALPALNTTGGNNITYSSSNGPKRSIILTAAGAETPTSAGAAQTKVTGVNHTYYVLDFDSASNESAYWHWTMPDSYDGGKIDITYYWEAATTSGDVNWCFQAVGIAPNNAEDIDSSLSSAVCEVDTAQSNANDLASVTETQTVSNFAAGEYVAFKVFRDAASAGDTMSGDARLVKVKIEYSVYEESDL